MPHSYLKAKKTFLLLHIKHWMQVKNSINQLSVLEINILLFNELWIKESYLYALLQFQIY